jgi:serine/threonine-protein kinase
VTSGPAGDVALALGARRDEEPYSGRDIGLLGAIAANLALLLDRAGAVVAEEPGLAECPSCGACSDTSHARCPRDGALLLVSGIPPVIGGRYVLQSRLGAGGMGTVYCAHDRSLGRSVAIKVLGEHLVGSTDAARRFQREAQAGASFTHPNVVTVHDFGVTANHRAFLVMERLEGRTLREELTSNGPLAPRTTLSIAKDLCGVLTVAHERGLVHRDLKPENVFLTGGAAAPVTKVLDFGIAKALTDAASPTSTGTSTGVLVGTLPYMSPEQLRGEPVDPSWDLWALAIMCQEMLTGERPAGLTPSPERTRGRVVTASGSRPEWPPPLRSFFANALALDRRLRPQNAASFREQLAAALGQGTERRSLMGIGVWTWPFS